MKKHKMYKHGFLLSSVTGLLLPAIAQAGFTEDSTVRLDLRNFYLDRSYIGNTPDEYSWSQGADLQYFSGYTDTPLQVGLDVSAQGAVVLGSEGCDGSLPCDTAESEAADNYGRVGATLKLKYSQTELKIGDHRPHLPIAWDDTSRQLDTIYEGAVIESHDIDRLTLMAGRYWKLVGRDSSDKEKLYLYPVSNGKTSEGLDFAGATYDVSKALSATYFYGVLHDIYSQQYFGLAYNTALTDSVHMVTDVRYFTNKDDGDAYYGDIDVDALGARASFMTGSHMLSLSWQKLGGDSVFPTLNNYVPQPYLIHWSNAAFILPDEQSYGLRYAYNFETLGVPGLNVMANYITSSDIRLDKMGMTDRDGSQSERDLVLSYTVQEGALAGLGFEFQDIFLTKSYGDDFSEFRFTTTYTYNF